MIVYDFSCNAFLFQALMKEIDDYKANLDQLKAQASRVIAGSQNQPALSQQIEKQLSNLDGSYESLQTTAAHIKVSYLYFFYFDIKKSILQGRLDEFLNKWTLYRDLLDQCTLYMENEALPWLEEESRRPSPLSQQEQVRQQNIAKVS
jgi:hypothetical protein